MSTNYPPVAPTSYPGMAEINAQEPPKTYDDRDFASVEDPIPRWRAVGVFGALILIDGIVLWLGIGGAGNSGAPGPGNSGFVPFFGVGFGLVAVAILQSLSGVAAIAYAFTEEGLAFFGAAATGVVVSFSFPLAGLPTGYPLLSNPGPYGTDLSVILGLLIAGGLLLTIGALRAWSAYFEVDEE
ncbi:MAG: hypothetical protein L3J97_05830 [Thermoplasmata archaeon]|nr:hypothetical protein [Thermoplasmata archaeon]